MPQHPRPRRTPWRVFAFVLLLACGDARPDEDRAARSQAVTQSLGNDRFVTGGEIAVASPVPGDLLATGGGIDVDAAVAGDLLALGGQVRLNADVAGSVVAAAGQTTIDGRVGRHLRLAGGRLELRPRAEVAGNVSAAGGQVRLRGNVRGHVLAAGGRVLVDGPVGGDVEVAGGDLELGPNARIAGKLRYRSGRPVRQDPAAQVAGGIERVALPSDGDERGERGDWQRRPAWGAAAAAGLLWTLGLVALAGLLVGLVPGLGPAIARTLRERPGASLLLGFAVLVCVPVAAVLLFVTLVGVPLGLVALALYGALLPLAYVVAAIALGDAALRRWRPGQADRRAMRFAAAAAVLLLLSLLALVPVLGGLLGFGVMLAGLGALALQLRSRPAAA